MTAAFGCHQQHIRICGHGRIAEWRERNKRIILRVNDQGGNANALDEGQGARPRIVITRVGKTKRRCDEVIVKLFNAADLAQTRYVVKIGKEFLLPPDAVLEAPQEILLINPIATQGHMSSAGAKIN